MKRMSISITVSDNGCLAFYGPLVAQTSTAAKNNSTKPCFYVARTMDAKDVGESLLAFIADATMTNDKPVFTPTPAAPAPNDDPLF